MINFHTVDFNLLMQIYRATHNGIFDKIMPVITNLGYLGLIWILISIVLLINKKYRKVGILCIVAIILTSIAGEGILKNIIHRPRPFSEAPEMQLLIAKPTTYSFPSGHTASSFAAAYVISKGIKKLTLPVFILAALIAFSRMYLFVHYPSDILGGLLLGLICAKITMAFFNKFYAKKS